MKRSVALIAISLSALFAVGCTAQPQLPDGVTVASDFFPDGLPVFEDDVLEETVQSDKETAFAQFEGNDSKLDKLKEAFEALGFESVTETTVQSTDRPVVSAKGEGYEVIVYSNGDGSYAYTAMKW